MLGISTVAVVYAKAPLAAFDSDKDAIEYAEEQGEVNKRTVRWRRVPLATGGDVRDGVAFVAHDAHGPIAAFQDEHAAVEYCESLNASVYYNALTAVMVPHAVTRGYGALPNPEGEVF